MLRLQKLASARRPTLPNGRRNYLRGDADFGHAEHSQAEKNMFLRFCAEGTVLGGAMAFWWKMSCDADKAKVDRYYMQLRKETAIAMAAAGDDDE